MKALKHITNISIIILQINTILNQQIDTKQKQIKFLYYTNRLLELYKLNYRVKNNRLLYKSNFIINSYLNQQIDNRVKCFFIYAHLTKLFKILY